MDKLYEKESKVKAEAEWEISVLRGQLDEQRHKFWQLREEQKKVENKIMSLEVEIQNKERMKGRSRYKKIIDMLNGRMKGIDVVADAATTPHNCSGGPTTL